MSIPPIHQDKWHQLASTTISPMPRPETLAPHVDGWLKPKDPNKTTQELIAEIRNEYSLNIGTETDWDARRKSQAVVVELKCRFVEK